MEKNGPATSKVFELVKSGSVVLSIGLWLEETYTQHIYPPEF